MFMFLHLKLDGVCFPLYLFEIFQLTENYHYNADIKYE